MGFENFLKLTLYLAIGIPLAKLATRRFKFGVALIFLGMYFKACVDVSQGLNFGINFYLLDAVFLLVFVAACARLLVVRRFSSGHKLWLAFGFLILLSFVFGVSAYGASAGVPFRKFFYFFATTLYFMSFKYDSKKINYVIKAWLIFAAFLVFSLLPRWLIDPVKLGIPLISGNSEDSLRVIPSDMALILAESAVIAVMLQARGALSNIWKYMIPLWLAAVIVLQHRSVWISCIVGISVAFLLSRNPATFMRMSRQLTVVSIVFGLGALLLILSGKINTLALFSSLGQSFDTGVRLDTTAGERLNSWRVLFAKWAAGGPRVWFLGFPFGTSMARYVETVSGQIRLIEYGAHNAYVEILLYAGLIGILLFASTFLQTLLGLYKLRANNFYIFLSSRILLVLILMQLSYYVPYGIDFAQAIWLGMAVSLLASNLEFKLRPRQ